METTKVSLNKQDRWDGVWETREKGVVRVKGNAAINGGKFLTFDFDGTCFQGREWDLMEKLREGGKEYEEFVAGERGKG